MTSAALLAAPDLPVYFDDFPLPDRAPYGIAVDMGLVRSEMAAGNARQRRLYRNMPQTFSLSFHLHTNQLALWQYWVNVYAYDWFFLPLASMYAPGADWSPDGEQPTGLISPHAARFISDLTLTMDGHDWWSVSVVAEISPAMFAQAPVPPAFSRIDAMGPGDELADALDGLHPAAPATGGPVDAGDLGARGPSLAFSSSPALEAIR